MSWMIVRGDARQIPLADKIVDAVVTDPPYGLSFMGKEWDHGVPGVEFWREAGRVLKPGAYLLAFGGTRTFHRLTCAIEDAGFEIRDTFCWLHGQGFPKNLDVSKAIDKAAGAVRKVIGEKLLWGHNAGSGAGSFSKNAYEGQTGITRTEPLTAPTTDAAREWQGWGTALKPSFEPIIVARKPIEGTVADNVQKWGTGAMNIDACRIPGMPEATRFDPSKHSHNGWRMNATGEQCAANASPSGRWPANVILDEEAAVMLDEQSGELTSGRHSLDYASGKSSGLYEFGSNGYQPKNLAPDVGGASRFFYTAKADRKDRGEGNDHPTVKPQAIIEYLLKLVSRPGALILDPFCGSGTTVLVADKMGRNAIGLDNDVQSPTKARRRVYNDAPLLADA